MPLERTEGLDRETVSAAWQAFIEGAPVPLRDVRPVIHDSWLRCKNAGVEPRAQVAPFIGGGRTVRTASHPCRAGGGYPAHLAAAQGQPKGPAGTDSLASARCSAFMERTTDY